MSRWDMMMTDRDPAALAADRGRQPWIRQGSEDADRDRKCWMKIRNGLRQMLQGVEELKGLPRSFETKKEQGRRVDTPG